jgi:hypothetical protein
VHRCEPPCRHIVDIATRIAHIRDTHDTHAFTKTRTRQSLQCTQALGGERSGATTSFDVAAASALVEMPEYTADGLQVGLVLQWGGINCE